NRTSGKRNVRPVVWTAGGTRMRTVRLVASAMAVALGFPGAARAQDTPKAGIVIAYPTAFGVLWHASDKIAIRPEFSVSGTSSSLTIPTGTPVVTVSSGWSAGFGLSALFYLHTQDSLRTYFVPRFTYSHASSSVNSTAAAALTSDTGSDSYGGSGAF